MYRSATTRSEKRAAEINASGIVMVSIFQTRHFRRFGKFAHICGDSRELSSAQFTQRTRRDFLFASASTECM